jgi:hypothetical protein
LVHNNNRRFFMNKFMLSLFTVSVSLITAVILSCYVEHDDDTQVCSGVEYDPGEYACVRGELVPLDDDGNSSPSGNTSSSSRGTGGGSSSSSELSIVADDDWYDNSKNEFTITTAGQLAKLAELVNGRNDFEGKIIKLGANIMLNDTANWSSWANNPPSREWIPIGRQYRPFKGTFDGAGFTVSGIYIKAADKSQGLFGLLEGTIKNLKVRASYINGTNEIGGIVAWNEGFIDGCSFFGRVEGTDDVGGLVGSHRGRISNSYSAARVIGIDRVGGLVGSLFYYGTAINGSFSTGNVTGRNRVGGFIGESTHNINGGGISNSYSTGNVTGIKEVGGFSGYELATRIINSYSTGVVSGTEIVGGFIGGCDIQDIDVTAYYYDKEISGQSKWNGEEDIGGNGRSTAAMKQKSTFAGWDFEDTWGIDSDINNGYPYLLGIDY